MFSFLTRSKKPGRSADSPAVSSSPISSILRTLSQPVRRSRFLAALVGLGFGLSVAPAIAITPQPTGPGNTRGAIAQKPPVELTIVSFAVTKEAFEKIFPLFAEKWQRENNQEVKINGSYGGSGSQARAVIDGLEADVVYLALSLDVTKIQQAGLIDPGWEKEFPYDAVASRSVIAFVTRPGNPKGLRSWEDLAKPGVQVITANPKTSGIARWNFLGIWSSQLLGGGEDKAKDFARQVFANAPVLPKDARESSDIFFTKGQGDVLLNYEHEVILAAQKGQQGIFSVIPQTNVSIENTVAVVDKVAKKRGTEEVAKALVKFLYSPEAQRELAKVGFRPTDENVFKEFERQFPKVNKLYKASDLGGWDTIQKKFFDDGGVFDQIYQPR